MHDRKPTRYICHTGHAYSLRALAQLQSDVTEAALFTSVRVLQEKEAILRRLGAEQALELPGSEPVILGEADALAKGLAVLQSLTKDVPGGASYDAP